MQRGGCPQVKRHSDRPDAVLWQTGEISISENSYHPPQGHADNLQCTDGTWCSVTEAASGTCTFSGTLLWSTARPLAAARRDVWVEPVPRSQKNSVLQSCYGTYVGCSFVDAFRVTGLHLPDNCEGIRFVVRGVDCLGRREDDDCASLWLSRH